MGYTSEDVIGKDEQELPRSERNKPDLQETINSQLKKGKVQKLFFSYIYI